MLKGIIAGTMLLASVSFGMSLGELNSADKAQLTAINGIGDKKAEAIIAERKQGKYKSFEDLQSRVKGVGKHVADNIKNDVKSAKKAKKKSEKAADKKEKTKKHTKGKK